MAGYGDELIATGLARGAHARGKRIALGDGKLIKWGPFSKEIFKNNPNIAVPGSERDKDVEWVPYYKGNRIYNVGHGTHWTWNYDFHPAPGEMFFDEEELTFAETLPSGLVFVEPNTPWHKPVAPNKAWSFSKYQQVTDVLLAAGYPVVQFAVGRDRLAHVQTIKTPSFRHSLAVVKRAALVVTPEGGLHHGTAAVGTRAVVIFGGFVPPASTGYDIHINLTGGAKKFCGRLTPCQHCRDAMAAITVDEVVSSALSILK